MPTLRTVTDTEVRALASALHLRSEADELLARFFTPLEEILGTPPLSLHVTFSQEFDQGGGYDTIADWHVELPGGYRLSVGEAGTETDAPLSEAQTAALWMQGDALQAPLTAGRCLDLLPTPALTGQVGVIPAEYLRALAARTLPALYVGSTQAEFSLPGAATPSSL